MTHPDPLADLVRRMAPRVHDAGVWGTIQAQVDGTGARSRRQRAQRFKVAASLSMVVVMVMAVAVGTILVARGDTDLSRIQEPPAIDVVGDDADGTRGNPTATPIAQIPEGADPDVPGPADQARPQLGVYSRFGAAMDAQSGCVVAFSTTSGTWTFDVITNRWRVMEPDQEPEFEGGFLLVYEAAADLTVAFAQDTRTVWAYSVENDSWTRFPDTYPGPYADPFSHLAAYDPVSRQIVVITKDRTLWAYATGTNSWTEIEQTGELPPWSILDNSWLTYDGSADRLVLTAWGYDTWTFDLGDGVWTSMGSSLSGLNVGFVFNYACVAFDAAHGQTVIFSDGGLAVLNATPGGRWNLIPPGPGWPTLGTADDPVTGPLARSYHSLVYDPVNERVVMIGGSVRMPDGIWVEDPGDIWALDFGTNSWIELVPDRPDQRE